jgi:hypothetical protein
MVKAEHEGGGHLRGIFNHEPRKYTPPCHTPLSVLFVGYPPKLEAVRR